LSAVKTSVADDGILVLVPLYNLVLRTDDDFDMAWVTLVRVDTTVSTVCAAASFLSNNQTQQVSHGLVETNTEEKGRERDAQEPD
jgi:hypothetical protein